MKADRILCIRVKSDTIVTVPEDEIWNVSVFDVSDAETFDVSSGDEQFGYRRVSRILGGGIRVKARASGSSSAQVTIVGIAFKL